MEIIEQIGAYAGLAAIVGLALLSALYFSQARDVRRLREWAGRAPERTSEPAAQAPRMPVRPVPRPPAARDARGNIRPPSARDARGNIRPPPAPSSTGAAPASVTGVAAATPAAARAAQAAEREEGADGQGSRGGAQDVLSQNTVAHPPPSTAEPAEEEGPGADAGSQEFEEVDRGAPAPGDDEVEGGARDDERLADEELEEEEEFEDVPPDDDAVEDEEFDAAPDDEPIEDDGYRYEPSERPGARPAAWSPTQAGAAGPAAPRPSIPLPPTAPVRPAPGPATSGGSILPPYERSRPGGDPRFGRAFSSPGRAALLVGLAVVVLAVATLAGLQLAGGDEDPAPSDAPQPVSEAPGAADGGDAGGQSAAQPAVDPASVTVAVLNATTVQGAASNIGDTVASEGYQVGAVSNFTDDTRAESVVLYAVGAEREAESVSRRLDIPQQEQIDPESQGIAGDASVVILVGADKAQ